MTIEFWYDALRKDLAAYAANITRNIVFFSVKGADDIVPRRGPVTFMNNDAVGVFHAAVDPPGRTKGSGGVPDLGALAEVRPASNINGHDPPHLHKTCRSDPAR